MIKPSYLCLCLAFAATTVLADGPATLPIGPAPDSLDILKDRPDLPSSELLGPAFESQAAGIALRPPADCKLIKRAGVPDEVAVYVNEKREWTFKISRLTFSQAVPLVTRKDTGGVEKHGVVEIMLDQLTKNIPAIEVLRQDTTTVSDADVGMLAVRYNVAAKYRLTQQAIIAANDQLYYVLDLTTPGAKPRSETNDDPVEKRAVETFGAILDSVRLLDRGKIKLDQDQRLYRTRAQFVNWTERRLKAALEPEHYLRLIRDGKDIGYSYIVEAPNKPDVSPKNPEGTPGVSIGIRSRTVPEAGTQVDAESWMFVSFDRRHEDWTNVAYIEVKGQKTHVSDFGSSDRRNSYVVQKDPEADKEKDKSGIKLPPPVHQTEAYTLNVTHVGKSGNGEPVARDLPPFYLPQALGHLLPRLLPLREPKTFMFATYVGERREVMTRYIDIGSEADITLAGKKFRAVPVADRIGMEGSVTYHYMSPDGKYLGSVNPDAKIVILPTDAATLMSIWKDAKLTRPDPVNNPQLPVEGADEKAEPKAVKPIVPKGR